MKILDLLEMSHRDQEHNAGLEHEDNDMYWVLIAKDGKWQHTKAQPRNPGMNAATDIIANLHAKYPNMHLGYVSQNGGSVFNMGKAKPSESASVGGMSTGGNATAPGRRRSDSIVV